MTEKPTAPEPVAWMVTVRMGGERRTFAEIDAPEIGTSESRAAWRRHRPDGWEFVEEAPLYAHPADPGMPEQDAWRSAIDEALVVSCLDCIHPNEAPELALARLIQWEITMALDPAISAEASAIRNAALEEAANAVAGLESYGPYECVKAIQSLKTEQKP